MSTVTYIQPHMDPSLVAEQAKDLDHVLVLGYDGDDFQAFASGGLSDAECLLLIERFRAMLINAMEDL